MLRRQGGYKIQLELAIQTPGCPLNVCRLASKSNDIWYAKPSHKGPWVSFEAVIFPELLLSAVHIDQGGTCFIVLTIPFHFHLVYGFYKLKYSGN